MIPDMYEITLLTPGRKRSLIIWALLIVYSYLLEFLHIDRGPGTGPERRLFIIFYTYQYFLPI